jgi:malate/lactate dehydrogenase
VIDALTKRTQDGGTEVVEAKAGKVRSSSQHDAAAACLPPAADAGLLALAHAAFNCSI